MSYAFNKRLQSRPAVSRILRRLTVATFVGVLPSVAFAFERPLTLKIAHDLTLTVELAQHLAIERSGQLSAKSYTAAAYRELAVAAGQLPDPTLKFGVDNLPVDGADRFSLKRDMMTMRRIGVMQEVTSADKRRLRAERFEREAEKSIVEKTATAAAILRDTALAWLDLYYSEAMAALIAEQATQAASEIQAAEAAYRGGRGDQADIFAARNVLTAIDDRASEMQRRIGNAKAMLTRWIGDTANGRLGGKPEINVLSLDSAMGSLDQQLAHHPQIAMLTRQEEIAATEAKLAQANRKADWSVELAVQQRGAAYSNMVSVGISIPLQLDRKDRQDRELASKLAMLESAKAEREDTLRAYIAEIRSILNEWENNRERQARYEQELIPSAASRTESAMASYRGGKAGLADALAVRRNEIDVRLQALQLEAGTARLWAQLNFLSSQSATTTRLASAASR
jgi:outer membrane protein TolC